MLVVGLGNPGREYASHRHNVGFMVVDELAAKVRVGASGAADDGAGFREKFSGEWCKTELGGESSALLKPMTFMNESGRSVQAAMAFFKIEPKDVLVIHDELDLPFGDLRLKMGGGHAGHNGLRSIAEHIGDGFGRLRFGVGRPAGGVGGPHVGASGDGRRPGPLHGAGYVLSAFSAGERAELPSLLRKGAEIVLEVAARGFTAAMNVRNARPKPPKPA